MSSRGLAVCSPLYKQPTATSTVVVLGSGDTGGRRLTLSHSPHPAFLPRSPGLAIILVNLPEGMGYLPAAERPNMSHPARSAVHQAGESAPTHGSVNRERHPWEVFWS